MECGGASRRFTIHFLLIYPFTHLPIYLSTVNRFIFSVARLKRKAGTARHVFWPREVDGEFQLLGGGLKRVRELGAGFYRIDRIVPFMIL